MPALAPAILSTAVALSALGAIVLCVLVVLYGFTPAGEDPPEDATRRLLLTRAGHALAAASFAATAILLAIVLAQWSRVPSPVATPAPDTRSLALGEKIAGQELRLTETETRIQDLENALRRREMELPRPAAGRPPSAPPRQSSAPAPAKAKAPAATKPAPPTPVKPATAVSRPIEEMALPDTSGPAASPGVVDPPPTPPSAPPVAAAPIVPPAPVPPPAPVASAPARPAPPEPAAPSRPARERGFDLRSKLRDDWRDIQRGVDSAGDDFRNAVDTLRRRLLGK